MKKILSLFLIIATVAAVFAVPATAADTPSFTMSSKLDLSGAGVDPGDDSGHGNHQTRTVHTSHGDYTAYITSTYTDANYQTVNRWSLIKTDVTAGTSTVVFTGEKYYDSSQVSLLVDNDENVWAITSTSDSGRNLAAEGIDARAHRLDAKTGEVTSYTSIIGGGARDGYGYACSFYDPYKNRIVVMHAGGDYVSGSTTGASLNWTIFDVNTCTWQTRVRYVKIPARHCYMYGYLDENGGLMLMAQRDIKAASLGYPEIGSDDGLTYADKQYIAENNLTRWAANYCWDQLDLYYFPNITSSKYVSYSVCEADYSRVLGTQSERYTLSYRLSNYYPAIQNNNGGDFLLTESADGKKLLHITYNKAYIQAAWNRSIASESKWYHQVWDVTDGSNAAKLYDGVLVDELAGESGYSYRLYEDSLGNVYLISGHAGALYIYRIEYNGNGGYNYHQVGSSKSLTGTVNMVSISSHRGGSITDNKLNVLYLTSGKYYLTQVTLSPVAYEAVECNHNWSVSESGSTAPTCTEDGTGAYVCTYCNDSKTETLPATGHSTVTTTTDPTCTEDGCVITSCEGCDFTETAPLPAKGHSFKSGLCTVCLSPDPDFVPVYSKADLNGDGLTNIMDVNIVRRILVGALAANDGQLDAGDINSDGQINAYDANAVTRIASGI